MKPSEALHHIARLEKFGIDLGLDRVVACARALGNPQGAYPSAHVAGTNGKGSTCAFLSSILLRAGVTTGVYTSPPLERFGERIQVCGTQLHDLLVPDLLERVLAAAPPGMTQFEVITLMGFLHFRDARVEMAVVETGLGGRLDATNILSPTVTAVTNVGLEHAEYLGPDVASVAREKGGIAKAGVPLVTGAVGKALDSLTAVARAKRAPLRVAGRDFTVEASGPGRFRYRGPRWHLHDLAPGLPGSFQGKNLGVAVATCECLAEMGWPIDEEAVKAGVAEARWPGRFEWLGSAPRIVLDGAHNAHASAALADALRGVLGPRPNLWLVLGILGDKDAGSILADLVPLAAHLILTRSTSTRATHVETLEQLAADAGGPPPEVTPSVATAVDLVLARAARDDVVCITGSLTVVGEARGHLRALGWVR